MSIQARKTVEIEYLRAWANMQLARKDVTPQFQAGICTMLEDALHETGNYHGFGFVWWVDSVLYLARADLEGGYSRWLAETGGSPAPTPDTPKGEEYRRFYY